MRFLFPCKLSTHPLWSIKGVRWVAKCQNLLCAVYLELRIVGIWTLPPHRNPCFECSSQSTAIFSKMKTSIEARGACFFAALLCGLKWACAEVRILFSPSGAHVILKIFVSGCIRLRGAELHPQERRSPQVCDVHAARPGGQPGAQLEDTGLHAQRCHPWGSLPFWRLSVGTIYDFDIFTLSWLHYLVPNVF